MSCAAACAIACTMPDGRFAMDALALVLCGGVLLAAGLQYAAMWRDTARDR